MHEFHTFNQMDAAEIDAYIDNPDKITPNIQQAYLTTWCKNSILGSFQQSKVVFHPLQTPQTSHQS